MGFLCVPPVTAQHICFDYVLGLYCIAYLIFKVIAGVDGLKFHRSFFFFSKCHLGIRVGFLTISEILLNILVLLCSVHV